MNFGEFQAKHAEWVAHNFPDQPAHRPLLGAVEEVGELAHSHLKAEQGIRGSADEHEAKARDAVGDIIVYLAHYCTVRGWNLQEIIETTWAEVEARDWQKNRDDGTA